MLKLMNDSPRQHRLFVGSMAATAAMLFLVGLVLSSSHSAGAMAMYAVVAGALLAIEFTTWHLFGVRNDSQLFGKMDAKLLLKLLVASLAAALFLEGATLFGARSMSVLSVQDWNFARVAFFFILAYAGGLVVLVFLKRNPFDFVRGFFIRFTPKKFFVLAATILAVAGVSAVLSAMLSRTFGYAYLPVFLFFCAVIGCVAYFVAFARRSKDRPERFFLIVALFLGSFLVLTFPAETNISWDDQIHYKRSLALSYVMDSEYSDADATLLDPLRDDGDLGRPYVGDLWVEQGDVWSESEVDAYHDQLNLVYESGGYYPLEGFTTAPAGETIVSYSTLGYIPSAFGLWLGRLLHLPFDSIVTLGRWMSLLSYCLISFVAIKVIPVKKVLLCAIALLPTNLFLAANFSYDPWLVSFLFLAIALVVKALCSPEVPLSNRAWIGTLLVFFVALGPKAVYFPLIGLLLLYPKTKFSSARRRKLFVASVIALGIIVVASFLLPFIASSGGGAGDLRGGSGVNSSEQTRFILSNPLGYAEVLFSFLANNYLTLFGSNEYTITFSYLGNLQSSLPWISGLPVVLLLIIALTDSDSVSRKVARVPYAIWMAFLFVVSVCLIATSLYISFTPVGYGTVNGCQPRYLLPLLFPLFVFCFNPRMKNEMNRVTYNLIALSFSAIPVVLCCWYLVASKVMA